jgi:hypothetical protein
MASPLSPHSLGIAQQLIEDFFPWLATDKDRAADFYGETASLSWNGQNMTSSAHSDDIRLFLRTVPDLEINVTACDAQTLPGTQETAQEWSMVVVAGTMIFPDGLRHFHSALFIEADTTAPRARIQFQTMTLTSVSAAQPISPPRSMA